MNQIATAKQRLKDELQTRTCPMQPSFFSEVFEELWAKHVQPELDRIRKEEK